MTIISSITSMLKIDETTTREILHRIVKDEGIYGVLYVVEEFDHATGGWLYIQEFAAEYYEVSDAVECANKRVRNMQLEIDEIRYNVQ
jgi:hypothetical protein